MLPCVSLTMLTHPCAVVLVEPCSVERLLILSLWERVGRADLLIAPCDGAFNRHSKVFPFCLTTFNCGAAF